MFARSLNRRLVRVACSVSIAANAMCFARSDSQFPSTLEVEGEKDVIVENWSSTHHANPLIYFQPENPVSVQRILSFMHDLGLRVRVVGSALSPNGIGLSDEGMMNMAQCGQILSVNMKHKQVTVQAGARVSEVVDALRPYGLTLQNYASIAEQQIGGFVQVGAHGTGAAIPPVDMTVVRLKLHTPALGAMELSESSNPRLFRLAKVGLGLLGVVSEVTLQCVDAHRLIQHTFTGRTTLRIAALLPSSRMTIGTPRSSKLCAWPCLGLSAHLLSVFCRDA